MSSKKVKGQKLNFSEFVSSTGGINTADDLPTAPSGLPADDRHRGGGGWNRRGDDAEGGYGRRGGGRRRDDDDYDGEGGGEEEGPSRADEASAWRRAPDPNEGRAGAGRHDGGRGGDRYPSRDGDRRYGDRGDRGDRGGGQSEGGDGGERDFAALRRRRDDDSRAGGGGGAGDGDEAAEAPRSDSVSQWRSSRDDAPREDSASSSLRRNVTDADAEWRKFPMRDRETGGGGYGGERRGFGDGGGGGGGRFGRGGDDGDRRPYGGGGGGGRFGRENGDDRDDRGGGGGGRYDRDAGSRGFDREGGGMGGGRGGYDRGDRGDRGFDSRGDRGDRGDSRGDRGDRGYDSRGAGRRGDNLPTDEELERRSAERPAHLRQLLKKAADGGDTAETAPAASPAPGEKRETALERMEREAAERERAEREAARPAVDRERPSAGTAGPPPADDRPRRFGLGRIAEDAEGSRGALADRDDSDVASNRPPELAPIKLSALRKTPSAASADSASLPLHRSHLPSSASPSSASLAAPAAPPPVIDDSRYSEELRKTAVSSRKSSPLDRAVRDKQTVTEAELREGLAGLSIADGGAVTRDVAVVIAKSLIEGKLGLAAVVRAAAEKADGGRAEAGGAGQPLLVEALKAYKERKGERALLELVQGSGVDVLEALLPAASAAQQEAFLASHSLLVLKPIPDLTAEVQSLLAASAPPQQIVDALNSRISASVPVPALTRLVGLHVFKSVFSSPSPAGAVKDSLPLLARLGNDPGCRLLLLYCAQQGWLDKGGAKAALKDVMQAMTAGRAVDAVDLLAWRDDLKEAKAWTGKPKALLQLGAWLKTVEEEEKKRRPKDEEEEDEEDEDEDEEEDEDDDY